MNRFIRTALACGLAVAGVAVASETASAAGLGQMPGKTITVTRAQGLKILAQNGIQSPIKAKAAQSTDYLHVENACLWWATIALVMQAQYLTATYGAANGMGTPWYYSNKLYAPGQDVGWVRHGPGAVGCALYANMSPPSQPPYNPYYSGRVLTGRYQVIGSDASAGVQTTGWCWSPNWDNCGATSI